jgi:hypothetical protein
MHNWEWYRDLLQRFARQSQPMETLLAALQRMTGKKRIDRPIPSRA